MIHLLIAVPVVAAANVPELPHGGLPSSSFPIQALASVGYVHGHLPPFSGPDASHSSARDKVGHVHPY